MEQQSNKYGIQLAILYGIVWFIDLLDGSILNVALPAISQAFHVEATQAEWAIIGFLLALAVMIPVSGWLGDRFGYKKIFLFAQGIYTLSSLACGFSADLAQLVGFRIIQGAAGGLLIPVGMTMTIRSVPAARWAGLASKMNMVTLLAPALGPVIAGYLIASLGWPWLFFIKLPLSIFCLLFSWIWLKEDKLEPAARFDWGGFVLSGTSMCLLLFGLSKVGESQSILSLSSGLICISLLLICALVYVEAKQANPMIPISIFRNSLFSMGNLIQSAANLIFLGATFITGLFLQQGLKFDVVTTGWVLAPITAGMFIVLPLVSKFYNRIGPLPFIVPGLIVLSLSMFAFYWITPQTPPLLIAFIILCEGAASSAVQTPNFMAIFCEVSKEQKGCASALYTLFKQLSASLGVAMSTMLLAFGLSAQGISHLSTADPMQIVPIFKTIFLVLGAIPLLSLFCCLFFSNRRALDAVSTSSN